MSKVQVENRIALIYGNEYKGRIEVEMDKVGLVRLFIDIHGMHQNAVRHFINNIINLCRGDFLLTIIHGYNNGTTLRDMLWNENLNDRIFLKIPDKNNMGRSHFVITAA